MLSITLSGGASSDTTNTHTDTSALLPLLEATIQAELAQTVPSRFQPLTLQVRRGSMRRSNTTNSWWGENQRCESGLSVAPKNVAYRPSPVIGMSIGPAGPAVLGWGRGHVHAVRDAAAVVDV